MLELESLVIGNKAHAPLTAPLSFRLEDGECVLLCGDNGCGKSTLLRTLAGLQMPLGGSFSANGEVRMVPSRIPRAQGFSVREFIATSCYGSALGWRRSTDSAAVNKAIEKMGITALASRQVSTLSDGEFQKACIATAFTKPCKVLLLDEPTTFLDYRSRRELLQLLADLAHSEGLTVLLASHDLHECSQVCDRTIDLTGSAPERG